MSNYYKNALKISLHGHKLKGDFILVKFKDDKYKGGLYRALNKIATACYIESFFGFQSALF
jgi:hypothetical protein